MEVTKRKEYKKKDSDGKITIKNYLNTKLKSLRDEDGNDSFCYPIYTRITVLRQTIDVKSRVENSYCKKEDFTNYIAKNSKLFEEEKATLINIIRAGKPFENQKFSLKKSIKIYNNLTIPLAYLIDKLLFEQIRKLIPYVDVSTSERISYFGMSNFPDSYFNQDKTLKIDCLVKNDVNSDILKNALRNTFEGKKGFIAKESIILCCLVYSLIENNDFITLYNKYNFLWDIQRYLSDFHSVYGFYNEEYNVISWFSTNEIQNFIKQNYSQNAELMINQISDILKEFDFIKYQDIPTYMFDNVDENYSPHRK